MTTPPLRLTDHERHVLWLIERGLFNQPGNERDPLALSLQETGLIAWTERGWELTAKGQVVQEWKS